MTRRGILATLAALLVPLKARAGAAVAPPPGTLAQRSAFPGSKWVRTAAEPLWDTPLGDSPLKDLKWVKISTKFNDE